MISVSSVLKYMKIHTFSYLPRRLAQLFVSIRNSFLKFRKKLCSTFWVVTFSNILVPGCFLLSYLCMHSERLACTHSQKIITKKWFLFNKIHRSRESSFFIKKSENKTVVIKKINKMGSRVVHSRKRTGARCSKY